MRLCRKVSGLGGGVGGGFDFVDGDDGKESAIANGFCRRAMNYEVWSSERTLNKTVVSLARISKVDMWEEVEQSAMSRAMNVKNTSMIYHNRGFVQIT